MKNAVFAGVTVGALLALPLCAAAPAPEDLQVDQWLNKINRSSEAGDMDAVVAWRTKLADYAAGTGRYDLAARQYELLLATRPRRIMHKPIGYPMAMIVQNLSDGKVTAL